MTRQFILNQNRKIHHALLGSCLGLDIQHATTARTAHHRVGRVEQIEDGGGQACAAGAALTIANRSQRCAAMTTLEIIIQLKRAFRQLVGENLASGLQRFQVVTKLIELALELRLVLGPGAGCMLYLLLNTAQLLLKLANALKLVQHMLLKLRRALTQQHKLAGDKWISRTIALLLVKRAQPKLDIVKLPLQIAAMPALFFEVTGQIAARIPQLTEGIALTKSSKQRIALLSERRELLIDMLKLCKHLYAHSRNPS